MLKSYDDYYDAISIGYDELYGHEQLEKLRFISSCINKFQELYDFVTSHDSLLDIGCGTGISTDYFHVHGKTGIDPSISLIKIARDKHPICKFEVGDAESLDATGFDVVISLTAIQNFYDVKKGLKNIKNAGKRYILTYLKKSDKSKEIDAMIENIFNVIKRFEQEKDIIYFCR